VVLLSGDILALACHALRVEHDRLCEEQAVHNLDVLDEVSLHPILASGFASAGLGVLRERPYPAEWRKRQGRRRVLPENSERQRCDLVLLERPDLVLGDTLSEQREALEDRRLAAGTLFEPIAGRPPSAKAKTGNKRGARAGKRMAEAEAQGGAAGGPGMGEPDETGVTPTPAPQVATAEDAFWLEVKLVGQFCHTDGVPGPNGQYGSELTRAITQDVRKLAADPEVLHAGLLLVLLTDSEGTARHDLVVATERALARRAPVRLPMLEGFDIGDRIGNRRVTLAMFEPSRFGGEDEPSAGEPGLRTAG
jgi:hypothetical protein